MVTFKQVGYNFIMYIFEEDLKLPSFVTENDAYKNKVIPFCENYAKADFITYRQLSVKGETSDVLDYEIFIFGSTTFLAAKGKISSHNDLKPSESAPKISIMPIRNSSSLLTFYDKENPNVSLKNEKDPFRSAGLELHIVPKHQFGNFDTSETNLTFFKRAADGKISKLSKTFANAKNEFTTETNFLMV